MRRLFPPFFLLYTSLLIAQDTLSITFLGDIMQHGPQIKSAYDQAKGKYVYDSCFKYIREELSATDLTIGNLETTLGGKPYKGYPMFSAPDQLVEALSNTGVDVLVTANNHTCDRRKAGVIRTLDVLDSLEMMHTGSFRNQAEKDTLYPLLIDKKGFRLALLNYTYGTNGLPVDPPTRVNLIKEDSIVHDLRKARSMGVDKIIVFVHWGSEYKHDPNPKQKEWARIFLENGADLVIGAHPHVVQPMIYDPGDSTRRPSVLIYSLGNFVSNQRTAPRDGGALFKVQFVREGNEVRIDEMGYQLTWVWLPVRSGKRHYYVMPASVYEEDRQMMDAWSHNKMKAYLRTARGVLGAQNQSISEYRYLNNRWTLTNK